MSVARSPSAVSVRVAANDSRTKDPTIQPADRKHPANTYQISRSLQNLKHSNPSSLSAERAGSADTAAQREREASSKKPPRHRRCHSHSLVGSPAALAVPDAHNYARSYSANDQGGEGEGEGAPLFICDQAVSVEEVFGGRGQRSEGLPPRLVLVSSRVRSVSVLRHAVLPGISVMQYNYDSQSLADVMAAVGQTLGGRLVHSVAFIMSCPGPAVQVTACDDKTLSRDSVGDKGLLDFLLGLKDDHCGRDVPLGCRFDFLACAGLTAADTAFLSQELEAKLGMTVGVWRDLIGADSGTKRLEDAGYSATCVAELYFRMEKLRSWSGQHQQSLAGFEKIRTVGKGAYGAAVLYKKKDDDSLVILKEINMHDLTAAERQLALNEVRVLAMLDHPNIISYFDSFEEDGLLMIEMEYADGGTLAQFLSRQDVSPVAEREREVLSMFQQIVAAIRHIHQHNILHRDLKTDNIFLTKEGVVKVGDFGISKMLGSANKGAQTVLGTPYYISPEMCEGKPYSYKSDIWALGCILYEMACLQKTFEGTNLPALVHKIMQGQFAPIKGTYSDEFRDLVSSMLQRDPDLRPSANDIMYTRLSELMSKFAEPASDPEDDLTASAESISRKVKISPKKMEKRSVLYYLESSTGNMTCITGLPPRMKIKQVGVSWDHVVVVTTERQVYSWGRGDKGQLGHGDPLGRSSPDLVEALKGKSITMACCGEDFSLFGSDNGLVLTCGNGAAGCLGHGDWASALKPRLIEALLSVDVVVVSCGPHHVAVVGREGEVYSWGRGHKGQLGHGTEDSQCQPQQVALEEPVLIRDAVCGEDGTMLITDMGGVFACGSNHCNKLGLNNRQGFLMAMKNIFTKTEVEGRSVPTPVRSLARHRVVSVVMGPHHSAVKVEAGHVYTFGRNTEGQLGTGNTKTFHAPVELKSLQNVQVNHVKCGEHYTVASSRDHQLFYWGLRYTAALLPTPHDAIHNHNHNHTSTNTTDEGSTKSSLNSLPPPGEGEGEGKEEITPRNAPPVVVSSATVDDADSGATKTAESEPSPSAPTPGNQGDSGVSMTTGGSGDGTDAGDQADSSAVDPGAGFRPLSDTMARRSFSAGSRDNSKEKDRDKEKELVVDDSVVLFEPTEIIRIKQGHEKVLLGNMFCHGENLFIQVETTAPPPRRRTFKKRSFRRRPQTSETGREPKQMSTSSHEAGDEYSSEASEIDQHSAVPKWLKEELSASAEEGPLVADDNEDDDGNEADNTSDLSEDDRHRRAVIDSSMSSIHINRVLTPVKGGEGGLTPRPNQPFLPTSQLTKASVRTRTSSVNSSESNPDGASVEHMSDSSSSETAIVKGLRRGHAQGEVVVATGSKKKGGGGNRLVPRARSAGVGKSKSHEEGIKERLTARGFVSDVTVKRREEALLSELELMREEKRTAELQLCALQRERELQERNVQKEAEKLAKDRELRLVAEVDQLRQQLLRQSSQLAEGERLVGHLKKQLEQTSPVTTSQPQSHHHHHHHPHHPHPHPQQAWARGSSSSSSGGGGHSPSPVVPRLDLPPSSPLPSPSPSSRRGDDVSSRSVASSSKVCSLQ